MKLVLQCAMCGTHHPVGTLACSACRATGVGQLRLMFECQTCGRLDLNPFCASCPRSTDAPALDPFSLDLDDDLVVAEEVTDDPFSLDPDSEDVTDTGSLKRDVELDDDEIIVVDSSEDSSGGDDRFELDDSDADLDLDFDFDFELSDLEDRDDETEFDDEDDEDDW